MLQQRYHVPVVEDLVALLAAEEDREEVLLDSLAELESEWPDAAPVT